MLTHNITEIHMQSTADIAIVKAAVHKRRLHKFAKIAPLPVRTDSTPSSLSVQAHHKFRKTRKCGHPHLNPPSLFAKLSALDKLLPIDCGRLLWTAPNVIPVKTVEIMLNSSPNDKIFSNISSC